MLYKREKHGDNQRLTFVFLLILVYMVFFGMGQTSTGFTDGKLLFPNTKTFFLHFSEVDVGHFRCVSSRVFLLLCDQKLENAAVLAGSIGERYSGLPQCMSRVF